VSQPRRYLVNCSIMFGELELLERPAAARAAGFDAIEFWWPFASSAPTEREVDQFVAAIRDAGVQLVGLNFAAGDMASGERGLLSWPGRESEFRDSLAVACGIGVLLGTSAFNALYGLRLDGVSAQQQDDVAMENLVHAAHAAARVGAKVLLEPVSGAPRYPLLTADHVVALIERVEAAHDVRNVALLADLYHLSVNGDDVGRALSLHHARVGHVQIADAPGRHEPGSGDLDLDRYLDALAATGYPGWIGLEYAPSSTTIDSLAWLPPDQRAAGLSTR